MWKWQYGPSEESEEIYHWWGGVLADAYGLRGNIFLNMIRNMKGKIHDRSSMVTFKSEYGFWERGENVVEQMFINRGTSSPLNFHQSFVSDVDKMCQTPSETERSSLYVNTEKNVAWNWMEVMATGRQRGHYVHLHNHQTTHSQNQGEVIVLPPMCRGGRPNFHRELKPGERTSSKLPHS